MKMSSPATKSLSISLVDIFLISLIPLLHIKALALALHTTTTSLSLINTINVVPSNETDFHALLAIKSNIFHDNQDALSSWNESLHFCHWEGILCGRRHQRVTVIHLTSRGLTGSLSPYIGNLSFLRELRLYNNSFTGQIPTVLGNLFRLRTLDLGFNGFGGTIPTSLTRCSNLRYLHVGENKLVGKLPKELGYSMPRLITLYVHENNLTGEVPPSIGNLTSLQNFSAADNPIGGSIPNALGQLKTIRFFWLGATQISGTVPPSLYNLSSLVWLSVPLNRLWGSLPPAFGFMFPHLEFLQLYANQFNGPLPLSISNCSELVQLELQNNKFRGKVRTDFGSLRNLRWINLSNNSFKTRESDGLAFLSSLTNCSNLIALGLTSDEFEGVLPDSVGNLSISLSQLALGGNQLYGSIPSTIGNLVNLEILDLDNNLFTGSIPSSVGYLHKMQRLYFSDNALSGEIPKSIGNLSLLNGLYLDKNRLQGAIPTSLGNCRNLLVLTLSDNILNESIPRQLLMLSSLSLALDLSRNLLSGSLPPEVGYLKNIGKIDISENDFFGEIPQTLGSCISLENLNLQQNFFQGSIPSSMESLRGILNLDLSHNNLSGQIPRFLETIPFKNLNLSYNNFEGEIPMKGVFTNASAISVSGNYRLCGGISELGLPRCTTKKSGNMLSLSQTLGITVASVLIGVTAISYFIVCLFKKKRKTKPTVSLLKEPFFKVTYGELLKATEGFSSTNMLGFGSFGRVYKGTIDHNGELVVAVKVLDLHARGATKSFMAECEALRSIRHRNLVSIITCCSSVDFQGNEFKALVYEYMLNGNLDNWLHPIPTANNGNRERVGLNLLQRIDIAIDVACALDYLHHQCERPIIHCDLKPSNILLDGDMVAHVGDFGLARIRAEVTTPNTSSSVAIRGTIGYAAPEYGLGSEMSTSGDVYSYGILLLEMITRKRPTDQIFEADHNLHNFARIALPQSAATPERTLDAPGLVDDFYLNLLDWGSNNVLAIAIGNTVYRWNATDGAKSELVTVDVISGPVTSVKWAPDGRKIAIGLNNSDVQLWDSTANRQLRTLTGGHQARVGSLDWNNDHILTTGGMDGLIINNDVRVATPIVETYRGHHAEVCGLKWSPSGRQLASGGNDQLLHIWDRNSSARWLHRLEDHTAAVKALAWCPFQETLLASGGGSNDKCIKFLSTHTGARLNSINTGSQVSALLWSKTERELLSSHGSTRNQLTLWKYPSMEKVTELTGHTSRVLFMAQSPDGRKVASAGGDDLKFWNVWTKPAPKADPDEPFAHTNIIR